jgi:hypothetical protein
MTAPAVPHVLGVRCHFCSKFRPAWRVHQLTAAQTICDYCLDWHNAAIAMLAGACPRGCQGCGASWEKLRDSTPGVEVRLYVVPRDGIYQLLCGACVRPYVHARADLFRGTAFGNELNA